MTDRSLKIFCDLVETRNFSETGRRNYLTQPAISRHLKAFETKIGQRLIERAHGQLRLTHVGMLVYEAAREILQRYRKLELALQEASTGLAGTIRVATIYSVGLHELERYITPFLRRYPKVDLQLSYLRAAEIYKAILSGQADLGLIAYPKPHPQLHIKLFRTDRLVLIVPPKHPWATLRRISIKRLNGQPFIAAYSGSPTRKAIDAILRQARVRVNTVHAFDNIEVLKRAVEIGTGISIVPSATVTGEVQSGTLKRLAVAEGPFERPIGILAQKHTEFSLSIQKFIDILLCPQNSSSTPCCPMKDPASRN